MKVSIIIPAYNEQEGIAFVLKELRNLDLGWQFEIIVVDDGSTDGTAEILNVFSNGIHVIRHEKNRVYPDFPNDLASEITYFCQSKLACNAIICGGSLWSA